MSSDPRMVDRADTALANADVQVVSHEQRESVWSVLRHGLREFWRRAIQMGRLIIGVPDYDTYVEHLRRFHPERKPMTYEEFFVERQNARYKGGGGRCC
jgi:uncharacterized short protein YbdD (DUF466 family)